MAKFYELCPQEHENHNAVMQFFEKRTKKRRKAEKPRDKEDDDEEDETCTMCLSSFWYRNELIDHMKNTHNVEKPEKHLKAK
jgi:hypothetical protein